MSQINEADEEIEDESSDEKKIEEKDVSLRIEIKPKNNNFPDQKKQEPNIMTYSAKQQNEPGSQPLEISLDLDSSVHESDGLEDQPIGEVTDRDFANPISKDQETSRKFVGHTELLGYVNNLFGSDKGGKD